jgi:cysteinyl-tRNA synthetase
MIIANNLISDNMKAILHHMKIYIHNTLTGKAEEFVPLVKGHVKMYCCGPTVYDSAHIGNFKKYHTDDIVRRVFEYNGYFVTQAMNFTDIDDKTIKKSQAEKISLLELTRHYETVFLADIQSLNILTPHRILRATDHIKEVIEMIVILLEKDIAYITKDGVYFSIGLFKDYGKLAKIKLTDKVQERIQNDEYEKENPRDFAMWKFQSPEDGDVGYDASFGKGRPGWHIECSAMATRSLGETIDIHTGGVDNIFPHHTNEIAQSESATGKTFVKYWIHNAFVNINDEKMAKSKGNFLKLADLVDAGISPLAYRYWLLTAHYRAQVNFTLEAVKAAQTAYIRLIEAFIRLSEVTNEHVHVSNRDYRNEFLAKINDDFNMPEALALAWELIKDHNVKAKDKIAILLDFDKVFGLGLSVVKSMKEPIPTEITVLAEERENARKNKEWEKADALRREIENRGFEVKDTPESFELSKKN